MKTLWCKLFHQSQHVNRPRTYVHPTDKDQVQIYHCVCMRCLRKWLRLGSWVTLEKM